MANVKFYLRLEGVNFSNFVDDTEDLSTIRGGGLLLLDAPQVVVHEYRVDVAGRTITIKLEPVSSGASQGLLAFEVDADDVRHAGQDAVAEAVSAAVTGALRAHPVTRPDGTPETLFPFVHATVVVDARAAGHDFVADREALLAANRWQQMRRPTIAMPGSDGDGACAADHMRPTGVDRSISTKGAVSESVWQRRQYGLEKKRLLYSEVVEEIAKKDAQWTDLWADLDGADFAHDFDEIAGDEKGAGPPAGEPLRGKVGVIYLDGNGFTALRGEYCRDKDKEKKFANTVAHGHGVFLARLLSLISKQPDRWTSRHGRYRLESLLWGGDEMILVVPARQAWQTLKLFYETAGGQNSAGAPWSIDGKPLTYAGGLVWCHHTAPIHRITALARALADGVKREMKPESVGSRNRFAYVVLESFDDVGRPLDDSFEDRYGALASDLGSLSTRRLSLTLRGEHMGAIEDAVGKLRNALPRRQLHRVVQELVWNPPAARHAVAQIERSLPFTSALDAAEAGLGGPWRLHTRTRESASRADDGAPTDYGGASFWLHLGELWDYVGV